MEHSAVLLTCIKIPNDFQAFVLSIFEWLLKTGFTVGQNIEFQQNHRNNYFSGPYLILTVVVKVIPVSAAVLSHCTIFLKEKDIIIMDRYMTEINILYNLLSNLISKCR